MADGRSYAISHRATSPSPSQGEGQGEGDSGPPVHIVAFDQKLGGRPPAGRGTLSPHALVQDYLNRSDDLWGIVTNGATLRLLRDSVYFSRPSYIEFDLQGMLDGERLDEFILFYRLAHRTRLAAAGGAGQAGNDGWRCLLESYHQAAVEQGGRIRDGLRKAVEGAILTLANGFLTHGGAEVADEDLAHMFGRHVRAAAGVGQRTTGALLGAKAKVAALAAQPTPSQEGDRPAQHSRRTA